MKVYRVVIEYSEPVMGEITLFAKTEEDAINIIRKRLEAVTDLKIIEIEEKDSLPDQYLSQDDPQTSH